MATKRRKQRDNENVSGSVTETPGITAGRKTQERRVGSGNVRKGSIENLKAAERAR